MLLKRSIIWRPLIQANYYEEVDGDDLVNAMYKGMFESLDEYSDYYTQEEYQDLLEQEVTGSFSGIGATLQQDRKTKQVTVVSVQEGSPRKKPVFKVEMLSWKQMDIRLLIWNCPNLYSMFTEKKALPCIWQSGGKACPADGI